MSVDPTLGKSVLAKSVLLSTLLLGALCSLQGCHRAEVPPGGYGTILAALHDLKEAKEPFPFPMEGENDHQNCVFNEAEFH